MQNFNGGVWTAYVGLLISILAKFGFIVSQDDALMIIGGLVTLVGVIRQHFVTNKVVGLARSAGAIPPEVSD